MRKYSNCCACKVFLSIKDDTNHNQETCFAWGRARLSLRVYSVLSITNLSSFPTRVVRIKFAMGTKPGTLRGGPRRVHFESTNEVKKITKAGDGDSSSRDIDRWYDFYVNPELRTLCWVGAVCALVDGSFGTGILNVSFFRFFKEKGSFVAIACGFVRCCGRCTGGEEGF